MNGVWILIKKSLIYVELKIVSCNITLILVSLDASDEISERAFD